MDSVIGSLKEIFTRFFDKRFLFFVFLLFAAEMILGFIVFGVFGILAVESLPMISAGEFLIPAIIGIVLVIVFALITALFTGLGLNLAKNFLEKNKVSLRLAFEKTKPRFLSAFFQQWIVGIIIVVFLLIVFSPVVLSALSFLQTPETIEALDFIMSNPQSSVSAELSGQVFLGFLAGNWLALALGILACFIALLVFIPAFAVLQQSVFFENNSAISSIKRALNLGFKNFFQNYAMLILFLIPIAVVLFVLSLLTLAIEPASETSLALGGFSFIINLAVQVWVSAVFLLFSVKIFQLDVSRTSQLKPSLEAPKTETPRAFSSRTRTESKQKTLAKRAVRRKK